MLLNELAEASGVSVASIKYYRREGILPPGERITTTRADYGQRHLERLRLVGVLREQDEAVDYRPQATIDQLDELVQNVRDAGMPATLTVRGDPAAHVALDAQQQMATYRVVQEALTNVLKHAGAGASVEVELTHAPDRVGLAVRDTGRGPATSDGRGHGLIGMRERMTALGGDFVARERMGGGFEVLASLPTGSPDAAAPTTTGGATAAPEGER